MFDVQVAYYFECNSMVGCLWNISGFAVAASICRQDFIYLSLFSSLIPLFICRDGLINFFLIIEICVHLLLYYAQPGKICWKPDTLQKVENTQKRVKLVL